MTDEGTVASALSTPVIAKFGCEIETDDVRVFAHANANPPVRGTVLLERENWTLKTDNSGKDRAGNPHFDAEVEFRPLLNEEQILRATQEVVDLFQAIRDKVQNEGNHVVALTDLDPNASEHYSMEVKNATFGATLQATYGVKLADIGTAMARLFPKVYLIKINLETEKVAGHYKRHHNNEPLPQNVKELSRLLNMVIHLGSIYEPWGDHTVHTALRMMPRSDFCSIYESLLSDAEQDAARWLLTTPEDRVVPPFMEAIKITDPSTLVFPKGYNAKDGSTVQDEGPPVREWLNSIVQGRGEGKYKKDLLSPPKGYGVHTGDLKQDYGMGAMGVDADNGRILFEIRGAQDRPKPIPMNGQMVRAVRHEIRHAVKFNQDIELSDWDKTVSKKFDVLKAAELVRSTIETLAKRLKHMNVRLAEGKTVEKVAELNLKSAESLLKQVESLTSALSERVTKKPEGWAKELLKLLQSARALGEAAQRELSSLPPSESFAATCNAFSEVATQLDETLWRAGRINPRQTE